MKVLDAKGREIVEGSRVRLAGFGHMPPSSIQDAGTICQFTVAADTESEGVEVEWPDEDTTCFDWYPLDAQGRCPDLLPADSSGEAGTDG